ncbi:MAG: HEAT repeat domain-containing protein [Pirellulales bacterium]|nr:HEAT repeat domain-containing protein [Pirellulales bacterium]
MDLLKTHGHDRVVTIHFDGLMMGSKDSAVAKVKAIVPNATFIQLDENLGEGLVVGPVEDFKAFVRALDFGQITCEDEAQRRIEMNVDSFKLRGGSVGTNRGGNMQMHGWPGQQQEETGPSPFELERQKREKERQAREAEQRRQRELEKQLARQRELQGPDRTDPRYFEKMAERMISGDKEIRDNTLGALLKVDPSEVGSSETSKRIARQYKALLSEGDRKLQANGIHGVALWGGSYSVPMLLELLGSNDCDRSNRRVILEKLAEFQDPRAVQPVVALLQDPASRHEAYECLEKLGPLAEDVLIQTAPSSDPMVCQAAVELLGKVGTSKSLPILRQAASKGSSVVREKAKMSIRQIMYRKKTASGNTANTF